MQSIQGKNTQNIKAISLVASNDSSREVLQQIKFTGSEAVATNGFILAITKSEIVSSMKQALPYQKLSKKQRVLDDGSILDGTTKIEPGQISNNNYPPYERIVESATNLNHFDITLSLSVLETLMKSMKVAGTTAKFEFSNDNMKAFKVTCGEIEYFVMPMKENK